MDWRMDTWGCSCRFPHSDICGSMDICSSPQLFAAYHVFHRLLVPRHPPCALFCLTSSVSIALETLAFAFSRLVCLQTLFVKTILVCYSRMSWYLIRTVYCSHAFSSIPLHFISLSAFAQSVFTWMPSCKQACSCHPCSSGSAHCLSKSLSVWSFQGTIACRAVALQALEIPSEFHTMLTNILSVIRNLNLLKPLITGKTSSIWSALPCWSRLAFFECPFYFKPDVCITPVCFCFNLAATCFPIPSPV